MMSIQAHTTDHAPLESASMGRQEYWSWFLASGGTLIDGLSIFSLGVAMPLITSRFSLSALMVGLIGSALVLGAVVGAVVGGPAADRFGRKPAFLIDMTIIRDHRAAIGRNAARGCRRDCGPVAKEQLVRLEVDRRNGRRGGAAISSAAPLASGESALARGVRAQQSHAGCGSTATPDDVSQSRHRKRHSRLAGSSIRSAVLAAVSHAHDAGFAAVVSDGRCHLRGRPVYACDPRRHPLFVQDHGTFGRRICRRYSVRASAGGFAAASAKVGATLGIFVLPQVKAHGGVAAVLIMMAIVSALGAAVTAMLAREAGEIPEGRSLDEVETHK
jgi:hypothetical protein